MICNNCPSHCNLKEGEYGKCHARANVRGEIVSANYGQISALAIDPIEKKPLRRFYPGSKIASVGFWGCNLSCPWCQNDHISRGRPAGLMMMSPKELVSKITGIPNNLGLAYTYNEPLISPEYVLECAKLVREAGLRNVLVTNGCMTHERFIKLLPYIDALNIDLKTINSANYKRIGGDLDTILYNIELANEVAHVEVTTLLVPGFNDNERGIAELAATLAGISPEIPLHVSRFFPAGNMRNLPATTVETVYRMTEIAEEYLHYVYPGNV